MMKKLIAIFVLAVATVSVVAQTSVDKNEIANLYKTTTSKSISIHDPSVVWDKQSQQWYIYGSHYFGGKSSDLRNWTAVTNYYNTSFDKAFKKNDTRKVKRVLPGKSTVEEVDFPSFDAAAYCSVYADCSEADWVKGNQWAADVVWNETMGKWCYYVSLNGDNWASVVVLMTSDKIEGPYTYQGPVVFSGFNGQKADFKKTDLNIVLGDINSVPSRYVTNQWGTYYPNCIDPCAFFDEEGEMWCAYGSWSGGIFLLKLDKETGLRDYTYTYNGTSTTSQATGDDAYFGHRIAGGYYVSGEGPYIQHIGNYYYLFMSYGFYSPDGGYEMRVFRSDKPTGPYKDAAGNVATYTSYQMNYGPSATTNKGMKLMGAMNHWGNMTVGECAQGHNSACVDDKGRAFIVCHTKYNNGTVGHSVRAYQLYTNKQGWLVTAPFQFAGETTTDETISSSNPWTATDVEGDYHVIVHPYKLDYKNMQEVEPKMVHLSADGKVTGGYTGTWQFTDEGKSFMEIKLGSVTYSGVMVEQTLENNTAKALCFTAVCSNSGTNSGVPVWGYKLQPRNAIAKNYLTNKSKLSLSAVSAFSVNKEIMFDTDENTVLTWTSSNPDVVSNTGKYNPTNEDVQLTMTARLECGEYYWEQTFNSKASAAKAIMGDPFSGIVAYYNFDDSPSTNAYNKNEKATLASSNSSVTKKPAYETNYARFGNVLHQYFGAQKANSYTKMTNPLKGANGLEGFTVSAWINRTDANTWDALWSFFGSTVSSSSGPRLFFTGNTYVGFNDNAGNWFDINHPDNGEVTKITPGEWKLVTVTFSASEGCKIYINGTKQSTTKYSGSTDKMDDFNKQIVLDHITSADFFFLGLGSFWGSADTQFDDLLIYNRALSDDDVKGLNTMLNRVNDFTPEGVANVTAITDTPVTNTVIPNGIYDLQGRKVTSPSKGLYIVNGKKTLLWK